MENIFFNGWKFQILLFTLWKIWLSFKRSLGFPMEMRVQWSTPMGMISGYHRIDFIWLIFPMDHLWSHRVYVVDLNIFCFDLNIVVRKNDRGKRNGESKIVFQKMLSKEEKRGSCRRNHKDDSITQNCCGYCFLAHCKFHFYLSYHPYRISSNKRRGAY